MSRTIPAIFDAGIFRPLQPVELANGTQVEIQLPTLPANNSATELSSEEVARRREAIEKFIADIESLPLEGPEDGFCGRDHDRILYGKP